jgi:hypothetical protein
MVIFCLKVDENVADPGRNENLVSYFGELST